jgi:flagella basal body P-ring formation protein FlgA
LYVDAFLIDGRRADLSGARRWHASGRNPGTSDRAGIDMPFLFALIAALAGGVATAVDAAAGFQDLDGIRAAVTRHVLGRAEPRTRYEISVDGLDPRLQLARCPHEPEVFEPPGYRASGTTTLGVRCNAQRAWMIYVPVTIRTYRKIAVLAQPVARGASIGAEHLRFQEYDVSSINAGYFIDTTAVVGKLAKRSLNAGVVLTTSHLAAPRWVSRGEIVTLLVDIGGLQVRARGEALADGGENDVVRARNLLSGKVIDGVVSAPGTLLVRM